MQQFNPLKTQSNVGPQLILPLNKVKGPTQTTFKNSPERQKPTIFFSEKKQSAKINNRSNQASSRPGNEISFLPLEGPDRFNSNQKPINLDPLNRVEQSQKRGTGVVKPKQTRNSNVPSIDNAITSARTQILYEIYSTKTLPQISNNSNTFIRQSSNNNDNIFSRQPSIEGVLDGNSESNQPATHKQIVK